VRTLRKDAVDVLKDTKAVPSDEAFRLIKQIEDATKEVTDRLTEVGNARKNEILSA
jgi:ribosome recycling factor